MKKHIKLMSLSAAACMTLLYACTKYEDPPKAGPDDRLSNPYCNDSRAVNYNWGFPGKADNTVCIYPIDSFKGSWLLVDSMFRPNGDTIGVQVKTLQFTATEDTILTHLAVQGWCSGSIYVTANKYSYAYVDTLVQYTPGQFNCGVFGDTLSGNIRMSTDTAIAPAGTMLVNFTVSDAGGTVLHRGRATRQ